jgi:hypothetical protein
VPKLLAGVEPMDAATFQHLWHDFLRSSSAGDDFAVNYARLFLKLQLYVSSQQVVEMIQVCLPSAAVRPCHSFSFGYRLPDAAGRCHWWPFLLLMSGWVCIDCFRFRFALSLGFSPS